MNKPQDAVLGLFLLDQKELNATAETPRTPRDAPGSEYFVPLSLGVFLGALGDAAVAFQL